MTAPIISEKRAEKLNAKIRELDSTLFWSCNYSPTASFAHSSDAVFQSSIQDLYKFAYDTNCVFRSISHSGFKRYPNYELFSSQDAFHKCQDALAIVESLRSVLDHNHSEKNGSLWQQRMEEYKNWIKGLIEKNEPESDLDFQKLNEELKRLANELINTSDQIIDAAISSQDKARIANWLKETILNWFCTGTQQDFYRSQLTDAYLARAMKSGNKQILSKPKHILRVKINSWIRERHHQEKRKIPQVIQQYESKAQAIEHSLINPSKQLLQLKEVDLDAYHRFESDQQTEANEARAIASQLSQKLAELETVEDEKAVEFFFGTLKRELKETERILRNNSQQFTYLPQDLIQHDISRRFSDVSSPDGDFF